MAKVFLQNVHLRQEFLEYLQLVFSKLLRMLDFEECEYLLNILF